MVRARGGKIINIGSIASILGVRLPPYREQRWGRPAACFLSLHLIASLARVMLRQVANLEGARDRKSVSLAAG